ncbi:Uncharacterised protein r2_g2280 [Pycnogonum litorale]
MLRVAILSPITHFKINDEIKQRNNSHQEGNIVCLSFTPTNWPHGPITGLGGTSSLTPLSEKTAVPPGIEPGSLESTVLSPPGYGGAKCWRNVSHNVLHFFLSRVALLSNLLTSTSPHRFLSTFSWRITSWMPCFYFLRQSAILVPDSQSSSA